MKRMIALVLSLVMALSLCVPAWGVGGITIPEETLKEKELPVPVVETYASTTDIEWGGFGQWSPTEGLDAELEGAYIFSCPKAKENGTLPYDEKYHEWYCDFYVMLDRDLGKNQIFLGGYYEFFGSWVGFHNGDVTLKANEELPLLGSVTKNPWTYGDVKDFVGTFICGVGDVNDALEGATFTVMLRLTNPNNANEFYNVATVEYVFGGVAEVNGVEYQSLQEAVNEIGNNETITVHKGGEHSVEVGKEISFTVQPTTDVNLKIIPAIGYDMTTEEVGNGIKYTFVACGVKVGDVYYKTLDEAVNAVADGGTITILKNGEYSATVGKVISFTVKNDVGATVSVNAADGYTVTKGGDKYVVKTLVKVPVSAEDHNNKVEVEAVVDGTTAAIKDADVSLDKVIGDDVKNIGTVTIDFAHLDSGDDANGEEESVEPIDTVVIPVTVVEKIAEAVADPENDAESLEVVLSDGASIEFNAEALANKMKEIEEKGGEEIKISIKPTTEENVKLENAQKETIGDRKAYDITVSSGDEVISDMGGKIILHAPYELGEGESAWGLVVYYVDEAGVKHECVTNYDSAKKRVNWETTHLSVYMIDHVTYTSGYYPVVGGTSTITKPVVSADTFDAGIGMYVAMSVMAAAGSAIVIGKKKEF